jgi:hypothetical protein
LGVEILRIPQGPSVERSSRLQRRYARRVADDLETRLAARAKRDGVEFRVERRPDGMWEVGFWSRVGIPAGIGPEGMMLVGAEATTREQAVAELAALLDAEDEEGTT